MKYVAMLFLIATALFSKESINETKEPSVVQRAAYTILNNKCNVCHQSENPKKVFTIENMNGFSNKINRQVFVWKRMPKGKKIKLSGQEKQALKNWINYLN